jgi:hypothetical protein
MDSLANRFSFLDNFVTDDESLSTMYWRRKFVCLDKRRKNFCFVKLVRCFPLDEVKDCLIVPYELLLELQLSEKVVP